MSDSDTPVALGNRKLVVRYNMLLPHLFNLCLYVREREREREKMIYWHPFEAKHATP